MSHLPDLAAWVILLTLVVYAATGGADYGGGVWDLLASGPRASKQREVIAGALAPVWEANHVWLVATLVLLFTAFPSAFSVACIALHVPMTLLLLGIVFRGASFVFRQYGAPGADAQRRWGRAFAIASAIAPLFLGVLVGAVTGGGIRVADGVPVGGFVAPWLGVFPVCVGLFALALFAYLAAVYLTLETDDPALRRDFVARAVASGAAVGALAFLALATVPPEAAPFQRALLGSRWALPLHAATGLCAVGAFWALAKGAFRVARACAALQVALILVGWGLAQHPYLIRPDVSVAASAAPDVTLTLLLVVVAAGAPILVPSLYWLFRVFKGRAAAPAG